MPEGPEYGKRKLMGQNFGGATQHCLLNREFSRLTLRLATGQAQQRQPHQG